MTYLQRVAEQERHVEMLRRRDMPREYAMAELERMVRLASYEVHAQRGTR